MSDAIIDLTYSEDALFNRSLFFSTYNDINIFVEDSGKSYEYEAIFERLFNKEIYFSSIFPLGGKNNVLKKHKECNLFDENGKLNVFIVDGDFDNIWPERKIDSDNLIYLSRYNIESYFCCKDSIIDYMRGILKKNRNSTISMIKFDEWIKFLNDDASPLFTLFAAIQRHYPQLSNVSGAISKFLSPDGTINNDVVREYQKEVTATIISMNDFIDDTRKQIHNQFHYMSKEEIAYSIICGKFQFESLCRQLSFRCGKNINRQAFRNALITNFDIKPLFFLRDRIMQLVNNTIRS